MTKLNIKRVDGDVRFGSRAWALRQTGWTWEHGVSGDGVGHIYITCDGKPDRLTVAVIDTDWSDDIERNDIAQYSPRKTSVEYGGAEIGTALLYDLVLFVARNCSTACDDATDINIVPA